MVGLAYNLLQVYHSFNMGGWITLATLGIGLIVLASWIETRGDALKPALYRWKAQYKAWDY
jgi:TM2 domain-containing membrane protein YozV